MDTTPLFATRASFASSVGSSENFSPTKPLDLRSSILKAQQKSPNQSRLSTIAQRLVNNRVGQITRDSLLSTGTSESTTSFATALSEQNSSQYGLLPSNIHSFRVLANSAGQLSDPNLTPVPDSTAQFDELTPKAGTSHSPKQFEPQDDGTWNEHDIPAPSNESTFSPGEYNPNLEGDAHFKSNGENGRASNNYNEFTYNDTMFSAGDTMMTISTQNEDHYSLKDTMQSNSIHGMQEENLAFLFIIAVHPFNVSSLENKEDIAICLSFEKNDVAFVHTVDESGWGEVTLIKNLAKGWVPFNYFADVVKTENFSSAKSSLETFMETRRPLEKLLSASAKFLLNPQSHQIKENRTFDIGDINNIREGVKSLLQDTDCVSRSNAIVEQRPIIRKMRKRLLAEWYNLMIKSDSYKNTYDAKRIDTLIAMTYAVLRKAFLFYEIWSVEKLSYELANKNQNTIPQLLNTSTRNDQQADSSTSKMTPQKPLPKSNSNVRNPRLKKAPNAVARLREIHEILFAYFAIIIGRLDLIEHNPVSCELLEGIVHQIILLLRELLYISQACSTIIQKKYQNKYENNLDYNLDPLLSLVSELVSCVKIFVTHTINEKFDESNDLLMKDDIYYYTDEGEHMVMIISRMTKLVANAISGCNNYLKLIGDFELSSERTYPDFNEMKITPEQFVKKCSSNLLKKLGDHNKLQSFIKANGSKMVNSPSFSKSLARFSTLRSGTENYMLSTSGTRFLVESLTEGDSFTSKFEFFMPDTGEHDIEDRINDRESMKDELQFDRVGNIIGISFRSLVFMLTDEMGRKDSFLLSTFLLNYKSFGTSNELIECLIKRFDANDTSQKYSVGENNGTYSSLASRIRNRRRLVCKVFQSWMESYWDFYNDYSLVATLMNFFIEEVSRRTPIESKALIETAARLAGITPRIIRDSSKETKQLVPPSIFKPNRVTSVSSFASSSASSIAESTISMSIDEKFIERYELTKLPQTSHSTISLPIPILGLGSSSLLTRRNFSDIERLVLKYRQMVSYKSSTSSSNNFVPNRDLSDLLDKWLKLVKKSPSQSSPRDFIHNDLNLCDLNPLEASKQLSLIESAMYLGISPGDLLQGKNSLTNPSLDNSRSITMVILFTNLLSNYVFESILAKGLTSKKRVSRVNTWLRIALSALYFRNFNALASIMTALQSYVMSRLSVIWDSLSENDIELYEYLSKIIHPNGNYKVYRHKLRKLKEEFSSGGESNAFKSSLPVVPFFNLFLQDLAFIDEGNPDFRNPESFRPNKLINIDKFLKITNTISTFQYFQVGYEQNSKPVGTRKRDSFFSLTGSMDVDSKTIRPVPELQEFILFEFWRVNTLYVNSTDRAYQLSLNILPKNQDT